jgi:dihydroorotase
VIASSAGRFGRLTDAPATFVVESIRVVDPGEQTDQVRDVAVVAGRVAEPGAAPSDAPRVDGRGLVLAPGLCDLHTHLREPGGDGAETIESGARAAAHGGFTTVCAMPNTEPAVDDAARVEWVSRRAAGAACRVRVVAAASRGRLGERLSGYAELAAAGAVAVSDDGASIPTARLARAAMLELAGLELPLLEHAEEPTLARGALMRAGPLATRLGLAGWPAAAEALIVERDITLAAETGARVHLTHLSTRTALDAVRRAKRDGVPVSCDVTPHHLALTDAWIAGERRFAWERDGDADVWPEPLDPAAAYDGRCRVTPPLASRGNALALLEALADGTIDAIATDHAPHPPQRKAVPFAEATPGLIGRETARARGRAAVSAGRLSLARLLSALSNAPAGLIGECRSLGASEPADIVVFDPAARWRVEPGTLAGRSTNTPLLGLELPGVVRLTVADGRVTWNDGVLA